jgi:hypothetical protein
LLALTWFSAFRKLRNVMPDPVPSPARAHLGFALLQLDGQFLERSLGHGFDLAAFGGHMRFHAGAQAEDLGPLFHPKMPGELFEEEYEVRQRAIALSARRCAAGSRVLSSSSGEESSSSSF